MSLAALPSELMTHAFSFLAPEDLARASGVCKDWQVMGSSEDLWREFDLRKVCRVFDKGVWETHFDLGAVGIDASGAEPMNKRTVIPFLIRLSRQVEGNAGVTLLTMPKGLSLNKLIRLAAAPKQGEAVNFGYVFFTIIEQHGDVAVHKTHTIAITNFILKESRNKSLSEQRTLLQRHECHELPGLLSVASLVFLQGIGLGEGCQCRYDSLAGTFTRCPEALPHGLQMVAGSHVGGWLAATIVHNLCVSVKYGAGAMRDLSSLVKKE